MSDSNEVLQEFEKNVDWLTNSVPSEHIYALAWQMVLNAKLFLSKLMEWVNIEEEMARNGELNRRIKSLVQLEIMRKCESEQFMLEFLKGMHDS